MKNKKVLFGVLGILLVVAAAFAVYASNTKVFQGRLIKLSPTVISKEYHSGSIPAYPYTSRGKLARAIVHALGIESPACTGTVFPDVPASNPYCGAIEELYNMRMINGYSDGQFKPNQSVTRAELVKISLLAFIPDSSVSVDASSSYADVEEGTWYHDYILVLEDMDILNGRGNFYPNNKATLTFQNKIISQLRRAVAE